MKKNLIHALNVWLATLQTTRSFQTHRLLPLHESVSKLPSWRSSSLSSHLLSLTEKQAAETTSENPPPCFYKSPSTGTWKKRVKLSDLKVGDELVDCQIVQELYEGTTGPKVFCDCGVARFITSKNKWAIVNAMLRLDRKESVARKRATRLRKKKSFSAFVSRIRLDNQQLEVCLALEDVPKDVDLPKKMSASQLAVGQEVIGKVVRIEPYGVFVDVGANRLGLLHIQRVADLYGHYIDKAKGLVEAGLERNSRVRLQVASNDHQRLFLDFTNDAKEEGSRSQDTSTITAANSQSQSDAANEQIRSQEEEVWSVRTTTWSDSADAVTAPDDEEMSDDEEDDFDEYDEDRDIEDALGLGTY